MAVKSGLTVCPSVSKSKLLKNSKFASNETKRERYSDLSLLVKHYNKRLVDMMRSGFLVTVFHLTNIFK
jgi:hypothetical protein